MASNSPPEAPWLGVAAYGLYQLNQPKKDQLKMIISGGPGSGKGTQCELLVNKYGLKHISTGDALRHHVKTGTDLGREAKAYMERGDLVPDSLVIGICKAEMETSEAKNNGWLLDGMPRTKAQCDALEDPVPNLFLRLDVPDEVMMDRACGRRGPGHQTDLPREVQEAAHRGDREEIGHSQ